MPFAPPGSPGSLRASDTEPSLWSQQQQHRQLAGSEAQRAEQTESDYLLQTKSARLSQESGTFCYQIEQLHTVYSAIIYAPAVSKIRSGKSLTPATRLVCYMLMLNMVVQMGLLRVMYIYGVRETYRMRVFSERQGNTVDSQMMDTYGKFLSSKQKRGLADGLLPHEREMLSKQDDVLCHRHTNGTYTCMPPSVNIVSEWQSLDIDGDGIWHSSEAKSARIRSDAGTRPSSKGLGEAMTSKNTILFDSIIASLKHRAKWLEQFNTTLYLSEDVRAGRAIPKAYFDYWVGDAMFCTRFDIKRCKSIVSSGLFDEALKHGRLAAKRKGIFDYASATKYCRMMLERHGGCAQSFPATFDTTVLDRDMMCGAASLQAAGAATNPTDPTEIMTVTDASYQHLMEEKRATNPTFIFFSILIIYTFFGSLVEEVRDLIKTTDFLCSFPSTNGPDDDGGIPAGKEHKILVERISPAHRATLTLVLLLRVFVVGLLFQFGTWYLLTETRYMELVLNAIALVFITSVDEMMFDLFLEHEDKKAIGLGGSCEKIVFHGMIPRGGGSWIGNCLRKDCWGLIFLPILSVVIVLWNTYSLREPVVEALTCSCLQEGPNCGESMANQAGWWQQYWSQTLPAAIHQIEALRLHGR